jgi:hypothetical protein
VSLERLAHVEMPRLLAQLGTVPCVLIIPSTLLEAGTERPPDTLEVATAATAGASALRLRSPDTSLVGGLLAGTKLTVGGNTYTAAACTASAGEIVVPITPTLAANAAIGASVAVASEVEVPMPACRSSQRSSMQLTASLTGTPGALVTIPKLGAARTPEVGWYIRYGSTVGVIKHVTETRGAWKVVC